MLHYKSQGLRAMGVSVALMLSVGCTRDLSLISMSSSSAASSDGKTSASAPVIEPVEDEPESRPAESGGEREWYSYSGVGFDKISWTQDGEHVAVVYHQLVELLDLNNQAVEEIPFPEGCEEEYAVGERGVFFYSKQLPRSKAYPSKCLWMTEEGKLFVAGITIMEYDGEVVKEIPAVEQRAGDSENEATYWFQGVKVVPVETYEESWKWVDSKTLLLTTVEAAPDNPSMTCKFYYRYYPNTDAVRCIISGNDFVSVQANKTGIFYDSYHTGKQLGSIWIADEYGTRIILEEEKFSAYAISDEIMAMLRWDEGGASTLWYARMDDLIPHQIKGVEEYTEKITRWGSLQEVYATFVPLGGDAFYDVETGEVVEVPQPQRVDRVNPQGTHWIQQNMADETYRVMPLA